MSDELRKSYYRLVHLIMAHGERGATKKHGHYMGLELLFGQRLLMDTYNKSIQYYTGYGVQNVSLGIDFGGLENKEPELVEHLSSLIENSLLSKVAGKAKSL